MTWALSPTTSRWCSASSTSGPTYVEIFTWVAGGFELAHEHPDVVAIWEPMEPLLEDRDGREKWEFPHYERVSVGP